MYSNVDEAESAFRAEASRMKQGDITTSELAGWCRKRAIACFDYGEMQMVKGDRIKGLQSRAAGQYLMEQMDSITQQTKIT